MLRYGFGHPLPYSLSRARRRWYLDPVQGIQANPHPFQPEYDHFVRPTSESGIPADAKVLKFTDLSPAAQRAFVTALQSSNGVATVYGEANKPPEFFYSDYSHLNRG
jgi:hypothetical protein